MKRQRNSNGGERPREGSNNNNDDNDQRPAKEEIIEILDSSSDDEEEDAVRSAMLSKGRIVVSGNGDDNGDDNDDEDNSTTIDRQHQNLASCQFQIVGIRYYRGTAHPGEFVTLHREPHNPYDRNAIRVENMQSGKVGHIRRQQAAILAPLMDKYTSDALSHCPLLLLEASIPYSGNANFLPVQLDLYAVGDTEEDLLMCLRQLPDKVDAQFKGRYKLDWKIPRPTTNRNSAAPSPPRVIRQSMDWEAQAQELDKLFDKQSAEQLKNLPILPPSALSRLQTKLLDYQMTGVRWMLSKETRKCTSAADGSGDAENPFYTKITEHGRDMWLCTITQSSQPEPPPQTLGGIQADAMGLGKTLSALALLLANPPLSRVSHFHRVAEEDRKPLASNTSIPSANDLLHVPVSKLAKHLNDAGIATSTNMKKFQVIAAFVRGIQDGEIPLNVLSQVSVSNDLEVANSMCTLVVCPVSVISNWVTQIDAHVTANTFRVGFYQGSGRDELLSGIQNGEYDIVLVSYHTLASEYTKTFGKSKVRADIIDQKPPKRFKNVSIFDVLFYRIVLDEGHMIRSSKTGLFKSVCRVQAERKWVLTGTPFVNRCNDIHSLFSFLDVAPLNNASIFNRAIARRMQNGGEDADLAMAQLRTMMANVAIRRSKATAGIQLSEKMVHLAAVEFTKDSAHEVVYNALFGSLRLAFQAILNDHQEDSFGFKVYNSVFERLLRLRQACCSARLLSKERREVALKMWEHLQQKEAAGVQLTAQEAEALLEKFKGAFSQDEVQECAICLGEMEQSEAVILKKCQHVFCNPCMSKVLTMNASTDRDPSCPMCRQPFRKADMIKESIAIKAATGSQAMTKKVCLEDQSIGHSPKIHALLEALNVIKNGEIGVIFSQFTSFLDLIQDAMKDAGHSFTRLDGSMSSTRRTEAVTRFSSEDEDSPRFILCSLHAAGTGINLNRANHTFMMDTWFNESIENQAMDRIHRIGQERPVFVTRFVMKASVEERMIRLQETKSLQAKGSLQKLKADEQRNARLNYLRGLLLLDDSNSSH